MVLLQLKGMTNISRIKLFPALLWLLIVSGYGEVEGSQSAWEILETKYTVIHYHTFSDLQLFNNKIDYGTNDWDLRRLSPNTASKDTVSMVCSKVDIIFERVQEILEMRKKMGKVHILLHKHKEDLRKTFSQIYNRPCQIRAWYRYKNNSVYLNVRDIHEGMLAHELAHAIVDHYLLVRPPKATAEILARYVDKHLKQ